MPILKEALNHIFLSALLDINKANVLTEDIIGKCMQILNPKFFNEKKSKYKNISKDDAYIICSYTCKSFDDKYSPYRLVNQI